MTHRILLALLVAGPLAAQTSFPMVTHCTPVAVQRGTTAEVVVEGQMNFADPLGVLFDHPDLSATIVPPPRPKDDKPPARVPSVKLKVAVAADCPTGPREFRIATKLGLSSVGQLVIVDAPVIAESGDNNTLAKAMPLKLPGVASGRVEAVEDVDTYRVHAELGQTLAIEVHGARIQDKIHDLQKHLDPIVTLFDAKGRELAANDDYFFADPYLAFTVPATGDYFVQVRDSKYDGDPRWAYALGITTKPYAAHAFPFAGAPAQQLTVEVVGTGDKAVTVQLPTAPGLHLLPVASNPLAFVVSPLPQVRDLEPNDTPASAQKLPIPCCVSGRVGQPRDLDHFAFPGTKGQAIRFEVKARRFGTPLQSAVDAVLEVLNAKGAILAANDDDPTTGKDPLLTFTPPADGDYVLRLRDLNSKGGPAHVYTLEADLAKPDFALRCDSARAMIGPGSRTAWYVHVTRSNGFAGPVAIEVQGLPAGVSVNALTIPPTMTQGLLVLSADADAKPGAASAVKVIGTADGLTRVATANEEIYLPGGGRGRFDVALHAVAVTGPSDVQAVKVTPEKLTLKPGEEVKLEVTVERRADFKGDVILDVPLRHLEQPFANPLPPGVTVVAGKSKTRLKGGDAKGVIVLKVAADAAEIADVPVNVVAYVSINFVVKLGYSSPVVPLTIRK